MMIIQICIYAQSKDTQLDSIVTQYTSSYCVLKRKKSLESHKCSKKKKKLPGIVGRVDMKIQVYRLNFQLAFSLLGET